MSTRARKVTAHGKASSGSTPIARIASSAIAPELHRPTRIDERLSWFIEHKLVAIVHAAPSRFNRAAPPPTEVQRQLVPFKQLSNFEPRRRPELKQAIVIAGNVVGNHYDPVEGYVLRAVHRTAVVDECLPRFGGKPGCPARSRLESRNAFRSSSGDDAAGCSVGLRCSPASSQSGVRCISKMSPANTNSTSFALARLALSTIFRKEQRESRRVDVAHDASFEQSAVFSAANRDRARCAEGADR